MSHIKVVFLFLVVVSLTFSCRKNISEQIKVDVEENIKSEAIAANLKKMEFHIKGMTCEIGCARLIQSKLSKIEGVEYVKVSYLDSLAMVEFDTNQISKKNIIAVIQNIADGDLYKVSDEIEVKEFTIKEENKNIFKKVD